MENFLHPIFYNKCYICERLGDVICTKCLLSLKKLDQKDRNYNSMFEYCDVAKKILYLSKYPPYYFYLLKFLTNYFLNNFSLSNQLSYQIRSPNTVFSPIPLFLTKLNDRGFNQAEVISETMSNFFKIPSINLLRRVKDTAPLYDLSKELRKFELNKAFKVSYLFFFWRLLRIKNVILIDDLSTTRETFLQCSKVLLKNGIEKVDFISLFSKKA